LTATILTLFGVVGLVMAISGLYTVMAHSVRQRTREIGVRMAIGSSAEAVVRLVAGEGLRLAVMGVGTGLLCAVLVNGLGSAWLTGASAADTVNRWLPPGQRQFLFGLNALDPVTFIGVSVTLTAVACAASYFPARRASRLDPVAALRAE
jgi:ABC-type antimicrobial peptide transport system permease subunit